MKLLPRTQDHLDIIDIKDDILILSGGKFRLVVEATAINFELLSEDEQNATIYAYANLVNSIDYPIQIVIRTRRVDISNYLEYLDSVMHEQPSAALRKQLLNYQEFIKHLVTENTVLSKRFFLVIPYFTGVPAAATSTKAKKSSNTYSQQKLIKAKEVLQQKFSDLQWQFNRLGIKVRQLNTEELIRLFYEIYNPESAQSATMNQDIYGYTTSVVRSSLPPVEQSEEGISQDKTAASTVKQQPETKDQSKTQSNG